MLLEILAIVRQASNPLLLDVLQSICERHVAMSVVMSVTLAIGGDMHELRPIARVGETSCQTIRELLSAVQQLLKCDRLRNRSVVEEDCDAAPIAQAHKVRPARVNLGSACIAVSTCADSAEAPCLVRGQNCELDSELGHDVERLQIDGSLRQPHAFRFSLKARLEIANAPVDLRIAIVIVR